MKREKYPDCIETRDQHIKNIFRSIEYPTIRAEKLERIYVSKDLLISDTMVIAEYECAKENTWPQLASEELVIHT